MRGDTIVGYTYQADIYCPSCIIHELPTSEGEKFEGWELAEGVRMSTEDNLTEIAQAFGIDRFDESSYDSDDFPKVVFVGMVEEGDVCGRCWLPLVED